MNYWLLKTEPGDYSYADLERDKATIWEGVRNNQALVYLRQIRKGDEAFIYHTGKEKHIAGVAKVVKGPYPDPDEDDVKRVVVDIRPTRPLAVPVPLAKVKADPSMARFQLVRLPRLSVMPVPVPVWKKLLRWGGL